MYDAVDTTAIPADAMAVAGYVNGRWPTFSSLAKSHPNAKRLSIAVSAEADAECLDIERFDAVPAQAPAWVRRQKARGVKKPVVYCSVSDAPKVLSILDISGIRRSQVRLWTAHYTGKPHRCDSACGFGLATKADATQFTDKALGKSLDASLVSAGFFDPGVPAALRRKALRAWILARHVQGRSWASLKKTSQWKAWRKLGGK